MRLRPIPLVLTVLLAGCGYQDGQLVKRAQTSMVGLSEADLESCVGAPDQRTTVDGSDVLTYYNSSSGSGGVNLTLPIVGGVSFSGGGYCHTTFKVTDGRVAQVHYTGDNDETLGTHGVCAPIIRGCVPQ